MTKNNIKKSRLPEPRFAFAKKSSDDDFKPDTEEPEEIEDKKTLNSPPQEFVNENRLQPLVGKMEYVRITTQIAPQIDRQLEYARVILGKKKQDLINDILSSGLKNLGISFPKL